MKRKIYTIMYTTLILLNVNLVFSFISHPAVKSTIIRNPQTHTITTAARKITWSVSWTSFTKTKLFFFSIYFFCFGNCNKIKLWKKNKHNNNNVHKTLRKWFKFDWAKAPNTMKNMYKFYFKVKKMKKKKYIWRHQ